jgi:hypothetical protein
VCHHRRTAFCPRLCCCPVPPLGTAPPPLDGLLLLLAPSPPCCCIAQICASLNWLPIPWHKSSTRDGSCRNCSGLSTVAGAPGAAAAAQAMHRRRRRCHCHRKCGRALCGNPAPVPVPTCAAGHKCTFRHQAMIAVSACLRRASEWSAVPQHPLTLSQTRCSDQWAWSCTWHRQLRCCWRWQRRRWGRGPPVGRRCSADGPAAWAPQLRAPSYRLCDLFTSTEQYAHEMLYRCR